MKSKFTSILMGFIIILIIAATVIIAGMIFQEIQKEYQTFSNYIWSFTNNKVIKNKSNKINTTSTHSVNIGKKKEYANSLHLGLTYNLLHQDNS